MNTHHTILSAQTTAIITLIREANPDRNFGNYGRRVIKLSEEIGEHAEAYLNASSTNNNGKKKTWDDVREEAADSLIVAVDVGLTPLSDKVRPDAVETDLQRRVMSFSTFNRTYDTYEHQTIRLISEGGRVATVFAEDSLGWERYEYRAVACALDLAMTPLPDQLHLSQEELYNQLTEMLVTKLTKWRNNRQSGNAPTDAE